MKDRNKYMQGKSSTVKPNMCPSFEIVTGTLKGYTLEGLLSSNSNGSVEKCRHTTVHNHTLE